MYYTSINPAGYVHPTHAHPRSGPETFVFDFLDPKSQAASA